MSALKWATALVVAGAVAAPAGVAAADDDPAPAPTATPTPTATPSPTPAPSTAPAGPIDGVGNGNTVYVITVTTTTVNAPITWVAAPITTTVNNTSSSASSNSNSSSSTTAAPGKGGRLELDITGCRKTPAKTLSRPVHQQSRLRVPGTAALLVRVNGRRVGTVQLTGAVAKGKGVPLNVRLDANGRLTIKRPSGRILQVQACSPK
jgi:hypothetical protein